MRVVGIAIITALLSAGCAIQAGEPLPEETQRPNELVGISGGEAPNVNAHPQVLPRTPLGQNGGGAHWGGVGGGSSNNGGTGG